MFDHLFQRPQALARQRAGPLLEERLGYLRHLASQCMAWRKDEALMELLRTL
jgi:hypothetical protein